MAGGDVTVDGVEVTNRSMRLPEAAVVEVQLPDELDETGIEPDHRIELTVVHEDDSVLVVDKPAGLVVHPGAGVRSATLVHGLVARYPDLVGVGESSRPGIVHRLDRGTSGLLVIARTVEALEALGVALRRREIDRRYVCMVWGHPRRRKGIIDAPIGRSRSDRTRMAVVADGRPSRTRYEVVAQFTEPAATAQLDCALETGRTHQIRVHLSSIGHPVVGDARYGGDRPAIVLGRPFLHAARLAFRHPVGGEQMSFESPLPADLEAVVEGLR